MLDSNLKDSFIIDLVMDEGDMSEDSDSSSLQGPDSYSEEYHDMSTLVAEESGEEECSDEEIINSIISRQNATSCNPQPVKISTVATDISFHPDRNLIAVGDMQGHLLFYDVDNNSSKVNDVSVHGDNVRSLDYFPNGHRIASVSSDGSFCFTNIQQKKVIHVNIESEMDLEFYVVKTLNNDVCLTGHENGFLRLWDFRTASQVSSVEASIDTVNFIHYSESVNRINLTTGNGELMVYDVRSLKKFKPLKKSEPYTSELTCCTTLRSDRNIICGSGQGDLLLFDWEPFDFQPYKPNNSKKEILSIVGVTENIVITGNESGNINAYYLYPNRPVGLVGSHGKWDVTKLDINHSGNLLTSLADEEIKFWEVSFLEDIERVMSWNRERDKTSFALPSSQHLSRQQFFSDLNTSEDL